MTTDVKFRDSYSGEVDGKTVASFYRAFAEDTQPYCIVLNDRGIAITQEPSITGSDPEYDDETPEEHAARDREAAVAWVDALTELVWKAREYDEMMQAIFESEEVAPHSFVELPVDPFDVSSWLPIVNLSTWLPLLRTAQVVDELTLSESDRVWEDRDGDRHKFVDGEWHFRFRCDGEDDWAPLDDDEQSFLSVYAPYKVVEPVGVSKPRTVKALTASERDAQWTITIRGTVYTYKWDDAAQTWLADSSTWNPGTWDEVGVDGPQISEHSDLYLVEVL